MIKEQYTDVVVSDVLQSRYIARRRSPSPSQVNALVKQTNALSLGTDGSRVKFEPEPDTESSARAMSKALKTFNQEVRAIINSSTYIDIAVKTLFDRAESRLALLGHQAADLMLEACALQVARQDGFSLVALDSLSNISKIDQQRTIAEIDQKSGAIDAAAAKFGMSQDQLLGLRQAMGPVEAMKFMDNIASRMGESPMDKGQADTGGVMTPQQAQNELAKLGTDSKFMEAWLNKQHPSHQWAVDKKASLARFAAGVGQ